MLIFQLPPLSHLATRSHTVVVAASAGTAPASPIPQDRASAALTPTARLMMVDVNVGIESFPEYACEIPGSGRHGPGAHAVRESHRCERFTPGLSLFPDVREIRWFLYLRFRPRRSRLGAVQRSSANGRAISAGILDASESFPLAFRSGRLITKRKRAALHRKRNLPQSATLCDTNL